MRRLLGFLWPAASLVESCMVRFNAACLSGTASEASAFRALRFWKSGFAVLGGLRNLRRRCQLYWHDGRGLARPAVLRRATAVCQCCHQPPAITLSLQSCFCDELVLQCEEETLSTRSLQLGLLCNALAARWAAPALQARLLEHKQELELYPLSQALWAAVHYRHAHSSESLLTDSQLQQAADQLGARMSTAEPGVGDHVGSGHGPEHVRSWLQIWLKFCSWLACQPAWHSK